MLGLTLTYYSSPTENVIKTRDSSGSYRIENAEPADSGVYEARYENNPNGRSLFSIIVRGRQYKTHPGKSKSCLILFAICCKGEHFPFYVSINSRWAAARRRTRRAGFFLTPPLTWLMSNVATRGNRYSKQRQNIMKKLLRSFLGQLKLERSGHQRS